jgi:hypothetical protein
MKPTMNKILFSVMAVIFLLSACVPATPPTQSPDDIANQVATSVALTVAAQNTQTAAAETLAPPATNTPLPTQTEVGPASPTPLIPTATPFVITPPTTVPNSGGGNVFVKPEYACDSIRRRPLDNTIFKSNKPFDIKWTIVNTGTKAWPAGYDLKYFSGPQMSTTTRIELPAMAPGDQYAIDLDGVAPSKEGFHVMTWTIDGQLCYPYVAIIVEN